MVVETMAPVRAPIAPVGQGDEGGDGDEPVVDADPEHSTEEPN
jgi:hypothetical protein